MKAFGILNLNKPPGVTSRHAVNRIQKIVKPAKIGHAGTLDPMASGVLVVCIGAATRLVPRIHELSKCYRGRFILGQRSDTDDITGNVEDSPGGAAGISKEDIEAVLPQFIGSIEQTPPDFSAVKVAGQRAYKLARKGKDVVIQPKTVHVHQIALTDFSSPEFELQIECGSGTYIRSIGRDIGELLGCGAVMSKLERTSIGSLSIESSISPDDVTRENLSDVILPAQTATPDLPTAICGAVEISDVRCGRVLTIDRVSSEGDFPDNSEVCLVDSTGVLAAIARYRHNDQTLAPKQVFVNE